MLARQDDDTVFLTYVSATGDRSEWTVAEWRNAAFLGAAQLVTAGVRPGDRVMVPAANTAESLLAIFACWCANACCIPLEAVDRSPAEWHREAKATDARFTVSVQGVSGPTGFAEQVFGEVQPITLGFSKATTGAEAPALESPEGVIEAIALCLYSSGTTGHPKGINLTYKSLFNNLDAMREEFQWTASDRIVTALPINHGNGLLIGSLLPWFCGASEILCERFSPGAFWSIVETEQATAASVVPTVLAYLDASASRKWPSCFREFVSGSGPLPTALATRVMGRGVTLRQIYGLSETTCVVTMTPAGIPLSTLQAGPMVRHLVPVGPRVPHVEVAVLDEAGTVQPEGVIGELGVRGAIILHSYQGAPPADGQDEQWFRTGDEGCWMKGPDGRPWFYVTGRLKDLIIRGGLNLSPLAIEDAMLLHPLLDEAMAFGVPDEALGEVVGLVVVAKSPVSEEALHEHAARVLERTKRPTRIYFSDTIPKTRTGKIRRRDFAREVLASDGEKGEPT